MNTDSIDAASFLETLYAAIVDNEFLNAVMEENLDANGSYNYIGNALNGFANAVSKKLNKEELSYLVNFGDMSFLRAFYDAIIDADDDMLYDAMQANSNTTGPYDDLMRNDLDAIVALIHKALNGEDISLN